MRKLLLSATLVSCTALQALDNSESPNGLKLKAPEWQQILTLSNCELDQVIFSDGTKVCGRMEEIPPLVYKFGVIPFKIKELSLIVFFPDENKVQYVTHDGSLFVSSYNKENSGRFQFSAAANDHLIAETLSPDKVKYIIFKERDLRTHPKRNLFTVELQNGDTLSVQLDPTPIPIIRNQKMSHFNPNEIYKVSFNGGIYGETEKGRLGFSILKNKYLEVHVDRANQTLKLPWEHINEIRLQENLSLFIEEPTEKENLSLAKGSLYVPKLERVFTDVENFGNWIGIALGPLKMFKENDQDYHAYEKIAFEENENSQQINQTQEIIAFADDDKFYMESIKKITHDLNREDVEMNLMVLKINEASPSAPGKVLTPSLATLLHEQLLAETPVETLSKGQDLNPKAYTFLFDERKFRTLTPKLFQDIALDLHTEDFESDLLFEEINRKTTLTPETLKAISRELQVGDAATALIAIEEESKNLTELGDAIDQATKARQNTAQSLAVLKDLLNKSYVPESEQKPQDPMVYIPHEVHTLGEYTHKTRTLVRDHALEATLLPTASSPTLVIKVPGFFIDRKLVTKNEYGQFIKETHRRAPDDWVNGDFAEGQENDPVVNVSYYDAHDYAAWIGKRLPNESEWIRAMNLDVLVLDAKSPLREWTASAAYPKEGTNQDHVVMAPTVQKYRISQVAHSAPKEIITILNENVCNDHTGFRCVNGASE